MSVRAPGDPRARWKVFGASFALTLVAMLVWSLASPIASVPDEPSHFVRAGEVVRGQIRPPALASAPGQSQAIVPSYLAFTGEMTCFAFKPTVSAGCQAALTGNENALVKVGQTAQTNSPLFYALVGLPTLVLSGEPALYAMRGVSALLCALMVGFMFMAVSTMRRPRWMLLAAFVSVTPMVLFLGGSVNPNGVEAAAAAALIATLIVTFSRFSNRRLLIERVGAIVVSVALLTGTRSISLLWVALALGVALLLCSPPILRRIIREPVLWIGVAVAFVICVLELVWFVLPPGTVAPPAQGHGGFSTAFIYMLINTLDFGLGWIGLFGWVDTPSPAVTIAGWSFAAFAVVLSTLVVVRGRRLWAIVILIAALVFVPPISQGLVIAQLGYIWQGRYTLATFMMLLIASGAVLSMTPSLKAHPTVIRLAWVTVGLLGLGQFAAFMTALKRYVVGAQAGLHLMISAPKWLPPGGWIWLALIFFVVLAIACTLMIRLIGRSQPTDRLLDGTHA